MKLNTLEKLYLCMKLKSPRLEMDESLRPRALEPIERMLDGGVHAIAPLGSAGEGPYLDAGERAPVAEHTERPDAGRVPADCQFCGAHYDLDPATLGCEAEGNGDGTSGADDER